MILKLYWYLCTCSPRGLYFLIDLFNILNMNQFFHMHLISYA
jgi:hypothetical protein